MFRVPQTHFEINIESNISLRVARGLEEQNITHKSSTSLNEPCNTSEHNGGRLSEQSPVLPPTQCLRFKQL